MTNFAIIEDDDCGNIHLPENYMTTTKEIGEALKARRKRLGWTLEHVAEQAGIRIATLSEMENGAGFRSETLLAVLKVLDLELSVKKVVKK